MTTNLTYVLQKRALLQRHLEETARFKIKELESRPRTRSGIFTRLGRAGRPSSNQPRLGIGLWIIKQIVEAHGETVRVWSEPGIGSTLFVRLPLRRDQSSLD